MHLIERAAVGVVLAFLPAVLCAAVPPRRERAMVTWETSTAWRVYKTAFSAVEGVRTARDLARVRRELDGAAPGLARLFTGAPALLRDLDAAMRDRLEHRQRVLEHQRRVDRWNRMGLNRREAMPTVERCSAQVARSIEELEHVDAVIRGLRGAGVADPWIDGVLVPALRWAREGVAASVEQLEHLHAADPGAEPALAEGRRALDRARLEEASSPP